MNSGSADDFEEALKNESILLSASISPRVPKGEESHPNQKTRYRQKIELLLALRADVDVEYLSLIHI